MNSFHGSVWVFLNDLERHCVSLPLPLRAGIVRSDRVTRLDATGPYLPMGPGEIKVVSDIQQWLGEMQKRGFRFTQPT